MSFSRLLLTGALVLAACSPAPDRPDDGEDKKPDAGDETPCSFAAGDCVYPEPTAWQEPIADYIAALQAHPDFKTKPFERGIDDLAVFDGRLYLGYGDANLNAGRVTPIEIRSWRSPDDEAPTAEPILMAGVDEPQFHTREETVTQYRVFGDRMFIAGVDATEDAWLGNVFVREKGGDWVRHRSVTGGVHVHDIAVGFDGALYAVGSGAPGPTEWNTGKVRSYLWKSDDDGETWSAAAEVPNPTVGDRRWTQLVSFSGQLQLFGYGTSEEYTINKWLNNKWNGSQLFDGDATPDHWINQSFPFDGTRAIIAGVKVANPLTLETLLLRQGKVATKIEALAGTTLLDSFQIADGSVLVMVAEGDAYPMPKEPTRVKVLHTTDLAKFSELVSFQPNSWPKSVALWHDGIYVGLSDGRVLRSVP